MYVDGRDLIGLAIAGDKFSNDFYASLLDRRVFEATECETFTDYDRAMRSRVHNVSPAVAKQSRSEAGDGSL
jgi:hypothetical protein